MNCLNTFFGNKVEKSVLSIILSVEKASILLNEKLLNGGSEIHGSTGNKNVQGEKVQKLDIIAHNLFEKEFRSNNNIHSVLSEEKEEIINLNNSGEYLIAMDPLDGSSNIDVNIPVGSIFSFFKNDAHSNSANKGFLRKGKEQSFAAYIIYGTATMFVIGINENVYGFTLNVKKEKYFLTHKNIIIPEEGLIFSINEGNNNGIDKEILNYLKYCKKLNNQGRRTHTARFIGSLVADFHRNMLKGGIFIYPNTADKPKGQLRLIYECNPIALIALYAKGKSLNKSEDILEICPKNNHERTSFIVGSKRMVNQLMSFYKNEPN